MGKSFHNRAVRVKNEFSLKCVVRWNMVATVKAWLRPDSLVFLANTWGGAFSKIALIKQYYAAYVATMSTIKKIIE